MPVEPTETRRTLARLLRIARVAAGYTHRSMGEVIDRSHAHVQRIEVGRAPVSLKDARAWLDAADADQDTRDTVLALVRAVAEETEPWRAPKGHVQAEAAARIDAADAIDSFQPFVVPGLLQTEQYTRWLGVPPGWDLEEHIAARVARQAVLRSGKPFRFIMRRHVFEAADTEQQARIWDAPSDTVTVRVLDDELPFMLATVGFMIYRADGRDTSVGMELPHGRHAVDGDAVLPYRELFDAMLAASRSLRSDRQN